MPRDDLGPDGDVDVLVEFEPGHVPGFAFFDLQEERAAILGRRVDLHAPAWLSRYLRDGVVPEAQDQQVAAWRRRPEGRREVRSASAWSCLGGR